MHIFFIKKIKTLIFLKKGKKLHISGTRKYYLYQLEIKYTSICECHFYINSYSRKAFSRNQKSTIHQENFNVLLYDLKNILHVNTG